MEYDKCYELDTDQEEEGLVELTWVPDDGISLGKIRAAAIYIKNEGGNSSGK